MSDLVHRFDESPQTSEPKISVFFKGELLQVTCFSFDTNDGSLYVSWVAPAPSHKNVTECFVVGLFSKIGDLIGFVEIFFVGGCLVSKDNWHLDGKDLDD